MKLLTGWEFEAFIAAKPVAVIHFDAEWDVGHRPLVRRAMLEAAQVFGDRVNFAEVDVDSEAKLAGSIHLLNVPAVAYFRGGRLVATLIGSNQNVVARVERVLNEEPIGYQDGTSATPHKHPLERTGR